MSSTLSRSARLPTGSAAWMFPPLAKWGVGRASAPKDSVSRPWRSSSSRSIGASRRPEPSLARPDPGWVWIQLPGTAGVDYRYEDSRLPRDPGVSRPLAYAARLGCRRSGGASTGGLVAYRAQPSMQLPAVERRRSGTAAERTRLGDRVQKAEHRVLKH